MSNTIERDLNVIWHPYTQMLSANHPIPIVKGDGAYLYTETGRKIIDGISSWWVNIHGHAHPYIAQKVFDQLQVLEHSIFAGFTHLPAIELAEKILSLLPNNQVKAFYTDNGSTAVEVALKMCLQYWWNKGIKKQKILAFDNAYHGDTFGAMSVSGRSAFTSPFDTLLFDVIFIPLPNSDNLKDIFNAIEQNKNEIACFIFEPLVQGAGGMLMYEAEYLDKLLDFCHTENILTIADEVMTGFGRTGKLFACEYLQNMPEIMCFSKGLTGGTMPLGLTTCSKNIFDEFLSENVYKTLFHGHSFTANPVACAASLASYDILIKDETIQNIQRISSLHAKFKEKIKHHPRLKEVRHTGTIIAFEWKNNAQTSYFDELRNSLYAFFLEKNILLRPLGNVLYILPPYCISNDDLLYIYKQIEISLDIY